MRLPFGIYICRLVGSRGRVPPGGTGKQGVHMILNNIGVYRVNVGSLFYIGSSTNIAGRKRNHLKQLQTKTHKNHKLQAEYNKTQTYEFSTIATCEWHEVRIIEQDYLDRYFDSPRCCNIDRYAVSQNHPSRRLGRPKKNGKYVQGA